MDALSDVLRAVRLTGAFFFDVQARGPWVAETPLGKSVVDAMFPGRAPITSSATTPSWKAPAGASLEGEAPIKLRPATSCCCRTAILTCSPPMLACAIRPTCRCTACPMTADCRRAFPSARRRRQAGHFVCGFLACDSRPYNPLLTALPRMHPHQRSRAAARSARISARRWPSPRAAWAASACWAASANSCSSTWCAAISSRCPKIASTGCPACAIPTWAARSPHCMISPARDWTLEALAQVAALSRSAFAERFVQFVGQPPMQYLANWRMQLATNYLRNGTENIASVANRVGTIPRPRSAARSRRPSARRHRNGASNICPAAPPERSGMSNR